MANPIQDAVDADATAGIEMSTVDGETTRLAPLSDRQMVADAYAKRQAASLPRLGLKMMRVRFGGAAPQ